MKSDDFFRWGLEAAAVYAFYHVMNPINRVVATLELLVNEVKILKRGKP